MDMRAWTRDMRVQDHGFHGFLMVSHGFFMDPLMNPHGVLMDSMDYNGLLMVSHGFHVYS